MMDDLLAPPHPDDLSWKIVDFLLPTEQATAFTAAISVFASAIVFLSSLFIAYHVIAGIVSSAYSGKILGEKYHQIWAPLRVVLGIGGLMTVSASGLSSIHFLERTALNVGTNLGNATAIAGVEHVVKNGSTLTPISAGGRQLAWDVVTAEVCHDVYEAARENVSDFSYGAEAALQRPPAIGNVIVKPARRSWFPWGEDEPAKIEGVAWDYGQACGSLKLSLPTAEEFGTFGADRRQAVADLVQDIRAISPGGEIADFLKRGVSKGATVNGGDGFEGYVDHAVSEGVLAADLLSKINEIGDAFDSEIGTSAAAIVKEEQKEQRAKIVEGVQTHGWMILGSLTRTLSALHERSASYASERAARTAPDSESWVTFSDQVAMGLPIIESQRSVEGNRLRLSGDDLAAVADEASILATVTNSISKPVLEYLTGYDGWRDDPLGDLLNTGNRMLVGSQVAFVAGLSATGVASAASTVTQAPMRIVEFAMVPGWWLIGATWIAGVLLSYILPMIPYIFMLFAVGALAMEVLTFAIAALVWCFAHIRMDGDELVSQAQSFGYHALFSLVLRQPITVLGFFGAQVLSTVLLNIFLMTWHTSFVGAQGNASIGIMGILVGYAMMIYIQWHLYLRIFGLFLELPTRVAQYLGAQISGWHDDQHGTTVIAGASANVTKPGAPALSGGPKLKDSSIGGIGAASGGGLKAREAGGLKAKN